MYETQSPPVHQWTYGPWTLKAFKRDAGLDVFAVKTTLRSGTRHGQYRWTNDAGLLVISMADARVNQHMCTAKVARLLRG